MYVSRYFSENKFDIIRFFPARIVKHGKHVIVISSARESNMEYEKIDIAIRALHLLIQENENIDIPIMNRDKAHHNSLLRSLTFWCEIKLKPTADSLPVAVVWTSSNRNLT